MYLIHRIVIKQKPPHQSYVKLSQSLNTDAKLLSDTSTSLVKCQAKNEIKHRGQVKHMGQKDEHFYSQEHCGQLGYNWIGSTPLCISCVYTGHSWPVYLLFPRKGFRFLHQRDIQLRLLKPMGPASLKAIKSGLPHETFPLPQQLPSFLISAPASPVPGISDAAEAKWLCKNPALPFVKVGCCRWSALMAALTSKLHYALGFSSLWWALPQLTYYYNLTLRS